MTKKEQVATVLSVDRTCRGVHLTDDETQAELFERWGELEAKGKEKPARAMIVELEEAANEHAPDGFVVYARPAEKGDWEALRRAAYPLIRLRGDTVGRGCGWNLNEEIVQHPFDGAEHVTECPTCGISISWKAPVF